MAPIQSRPKKRPPTSFPTRSNTFSTTKKDKQAIKHSVLLSKIAKSAPSAQKKRRRPNKKLVTTLESLADALDDVEGQDESGVQEVGQARVVVKKKEKEKNPSLSSRKGVMKRKAKLEQMERQRMGKNLATMAASRAQPIASADADVPQMSTEGTGMEDRWAALRRHVQANVERKAEFVA